MKKEIAILNSIPGNEKKSKIAHTLQLLTYIHAHKHIECSDAGVFELLVSHPVADKDT